MAGARHFQQLTVWQLADELRSEVLKLTARREFHRNLKLRTQTEDAVESACRNIAEGFGCETHREFARFLEIARRSLNELQDSLIAAQVQRFVIASDLRPARLLLTRLFPAMSRFIAFLDSTPDRRLHGKDGPSSSRPKQPNGGVNQDARKPPPPPEKPPRRRKQSGTGNS
jgi:four helix bundle protein